jgi:hypothetical protein
MLFPEVLKDGLSLPAKPPGEGRDQQRVGVKSAVSWAAQPARNPSNHGRFGSAAFLQTEGEASEESFQSRLHDLSAFLAHPLCQMV